MGEPRVVWCFEDDPGVAFESEADARAFAEAQGWRNPVLIATWVYGLGEVPVHVTVFHAHESDTSPFVVTEGGCWEFEGVRPLDDSFGPQGWADNRCHVYGTDRDLVVAKLRELRGPPEEKVTCDRCGKPWPKGFSGMAVMGDKRYHYPSCPGG